MLLVIRTVTQQGYLLAIGKSLQKSEREFLASVLNGCIACFSRVTQFTLISPAEFPPVDFSTSECGKKFFTRSQIWHPNVVTVLLQSATSYSGHQ
jgi:hypothetical protein